MSSIVLQVERIRQLASQPWCQLALLGLAGALLVLGSGFASNELAHSLAHDTRHAMGLPCH